MPLGIQSSLTCFLLAHVGGRCLSLHGRRRGPSVPGARSSPPRIGLRPRLETDGPRCQVVSARCFSCTAVPLHDAGRLASQARSAAVAALTSRRGENLVMRSA